MKKNKMTWKVLWISAAVIAVVFVVRWLGDMDLLTGLLMKKSVTADYGAVVQQYAGHRVQFDKLCQAVPAVSSIPNNTKFMLDNRSGEPRIITVAGVQHKLAGYGWEIVTLKAAALPYTLTLDCGSAQNVGSVILN